MICRFRSNLEDDRTWRLGTVGDHAGELDDENVRQTCSRFTRQKLDKNTSFVLARELRDRDET